MLLHVTLVAVVGFPLLAIRYRAGSLLESAHVVIVGVSAPLAALPVDKLLVLCCSECSTHVEADVGWYLCAVILLTLTELVFIMTAKLFN